MTSKQGPFWRWDQLSGSWVKANAWDVYPGQTLLLATAAGGYSPETGWEPGSRAPVDEVAPVSGQVRLRGSPAPYPAEDASDGFVGREPGDLLVGVTNPAQLLHRIRFGAYPFGLGTGARVVRGT
jgi:hypothetical protein